MCVHVCGHSLRRISPECEFQSCPLLRRRNWGCTSFSCLKGFSGTSHKASVMFPAVGRHKEQRHTCYCSVAQSCPTLHNARDCSTLGFPVPHHLLKFDQVHVHCSDDAIQPSHPLMPLLLLPPIFPSIKDFSNESALHIKWSKYWSFSFSISPSSEYSGVISLKIAWFYLLADQGTLRTLL